MPASVDDYHKLMLTTPIPSERIDWGIAFPDDVEPVETPLVDVPGGGKQRSGKIMRSATLGKEWFEDWAWSIVGGKLTMTITAEGIRDASG